MIPNKWLIPLVVLLVFIAYLYIGESALAGLLAVFLGKKQDIKAIDKERDEAEQRKEQHKAEAIEIQKEDEAIQQEIEAIERFINDHEDTTTPKRRRRIK